MNSVSREIRSFIARLEKGKVFVTRDLLKFGRRGLIDQILYLLVKKLEIKRMARGVFCREEIDGSLPSSHEIALAKARAFGKTICVYGQDALQKLKLADSGSEAIVYASSGKSSSFQSINGRIYFKGTVQTQVETGDSKAGLIVRALCFLGKDRVNENHRYKVYEQISLREDRYLLKKIFPAKMPGWLNDVLTHPLSASEKAAEERQRTLRPQPSELPFNPKIIDIMNAKYREIDL
jgi:hypothetical protein